jgi:hypothetical protein
VREGEKVLHLLETISPTAFMEQYDPFIDFPYISI